MSGLANRRVLLPALALVSAGALLAGCAQESTSTATSAAAVPASSAAASAAASTAASEAASPSAEPPSTSARRRT